MQQLICTHWYDVYHRAQLVDLLYVGICGVDERDDHPHRTRLALDSKVERDRSIGNISLNVYACCWLAGVYIRVKRSPMCVTAQQFISALARFCHEKTRASTAGVTETSACHSLMTCCSVVVYFPLVP